MALRTRSHIFQIKIQFVDPFISAPERTLVHLLSILRSIVDHLLPVRIPHGRHDDDLRRDVRSE